MTNSRPFKDYYATLGLPRNATDEQIRSAFREVSRKYHPDMQGGDDNKFREANDAYDNLGRGGLKKEDRQRYDREYDLINRQLGPRERWHAGLAREQTPTVNKSKTSDEVFVKFNKETDERFARIKKETDETYERIKRETDERQERIRREENARVERMRREDRERVEKLLPKEDKIKEQAIWDKVKKEWKENWDKTKTKIDTGTKEFLRDFNKDRGKTAHLDAKEGNNKTPEGNIDSGENKG